MYYGQLTSVMGQCYADASGIYGACKPDNSGTKLSDCNVLCLWERSFRRLSFPDKIPCPTMPGEPNNGLCSCGTISSRGYTTAKCVPTGGGAVGIGDPTPSATPIVKYPTGAITFSPNSYDFGQVTLGQASNKLVINVTNSTGNNYEGCTVYSTLQNVFVVSNGTSCASLPAGGICKFNLTAAPDSTTTQTAEIKICCGSFGLNCPAFEARVAPPQSRPQKFAETLYRGGAATLRWLDGVLMKQAGACTIPECPAKNRCDCDLDNYSKPGCWFPTQQECYCAVGHLPAVNCLVRPTPVGPSDTFTSGTFKVTGAASGAAVCFAGYNCGPCPSKDVCKYDAVNKCCINETQKVCLPSWSTCTAPVTPTPTVTPTATPNCYASGGVGRRCSANADCCAGLTCEIAGVQPVGLHAACTSGDLACTTSVKFYTNFATNFDWMEANSPRIPEPLNGVNGPTPRPLGPHKICVNPTGGKYPRPSGYSVPAQVVPKGGNAHNPAAMVWDGSSGFKCKLGEKDPFRLPGVCACVSNYEPALVLPTEVSTITSTNPFRHKREMLWALVQSALNASPRMRQSLRVQGAIPEARALVKGITCPQNTCAAVTCTFGEKLYFPYPEDLAQFQQYAGPRGGTFPASATTCRVPWNGSSTKEQSLLVICSNANPGAAPDFFSACDANASLADPFWGGRQPAYWPCGMDLSKTCSATPSPPPLETPTAAPPDEAQCQHGDPCRNEDGTMTGVWDAPNTTCCGGKAPYQVCIARPIFCTSKSTPTPTATPVMGGGEDAGPIAGNPTDLYAEGFTLFGTTSVNWGYRGTTPVAASGAVTNGSMVVACVKTCPPGVNRKSSPSELKCDCKSAYPSTPHYDAVANKCVAAPFEDAQELDGKWVCPPDYVWFPNDNDPAKKCRPKLPSNEFTTNVEGFPVCTGASPLSSRIPVQYGASSMSAGNYSGSDVPLYSNQATWLQGEARYRYAIQKGTAPNEYPFYLYADQTHCYCAHTQLKSPPLTAIASVNEIKRTVGVLPDTFDVISKLSGGFPTDRYGMVAVHKNSTLDGRLGTEFSAGNSTCACPNVNEVPTPGADPRVGMRCEPPAALLADKNRVFTQFDPVKDATFVLKPEIEPTDAVERIQKEISLPASMSAPNSMVRYARRIHKCQIGFNLDRVTSKCTWDPAAHQCDSTSPLPAKTRENQAFPSWSQIVNKRVACCTNDMDANTISSSVKFDCVDNSEFAKTASFNALWAADPSTLGGQLNAVVLSTGNYQPLTGWYTLDGRRCSEFSEFSTIPIIPGTVPPMVVAGQQEKVTAPWVATGTAIPMPSGQAFDEIVSKLGPRARGPDPSKGSPLELNHARRCPLLVRAALITRCPNNPPQGTNAPRFTVEDASKITRCPSADSAQVHVRVEQVFRIAGEPQMAPVDTIIDQKSAGTLNVSEVIRTKNGGKCLPGMISSGGVCKY